MPLTRRQKSGRCGGEDSGQVEVGEARRYQPGGALGAAARQAGKWCRMLVGCETGRWLMVQKKLESGVKAQRGWDAGYSLTLQRVCTMYVGLFARVLRGAVRPCWELGWNLVAS